MSTYVVLKLENLLQLTFELLLLLSKLTGYIYYRNTFFICESRNNTKTNKSDQEKTY